MKSIARSCFAPGFQGAVKFLRLALGLLLIPALTGPNLHAGDVVWTAGLAGVGNQWLASTNWDVGMVPGPADNAVFNGVDTNLFVDIDFSANGGAQPVGTITVAPGQLNNITVKGYAATSGNLVLNGTGGILISNGSASAELIIETNVYANPGAPQGLGVTLASSGVIYAGGTTVSSTDPGRVEIYASMGETNGSRSITLTGPGNVYLRNVNTYSGNTTVLNGALELDALGTAGNGAGAIYLSGGNIQSAASNNGYNTGNPIPNAIVMTANAYIFNTASTANSTRYIPFSGPLSGTAGTLTICNPTTVTGNIFCPRFAGVFTFNQPLIIGDTSGSAFTDNTADFSAVDLCNTNGVQTWNGVISGPGSVRRGTFNLQTQTPIGAAAVFTGNNTYSGGTLITSGTLFANNTAGSALGTGAVTVTNLGLLAGSGAVQAPVTVAMGGTIQPGANPTNVANLAVSSLTFGPGANYIWQISAATGTAGKAWDLLTCSGGWTDAGAGGSGNTNVIHLKSIGAPAGWNM